MSNPTSNFGWQMPTATDLVTDLPADFEVFGQAVDTDFVDLLGGTTGQVLSKTSATDLDFTWINNDTGDITGVTAGTGITGGGTSGTVTVTNDMATTITAAGDIVVGTGSGTYDNLPIGTTAQVLTADTTVSPYKVKWATPASGTTFSGCSTYKAAGQVISGATFTTLLFDTENYDTDAYHSTSSNTGRLTIPAGKTGYYRISLMYALTADLTIIRLLINGSNVTRGTYSGYIATVIGSGSTPLVWNANMDLYLTAADYVEAQIYSVGGGTTQQQIFSIAYMGA